MCRTIQEISLNNFRSLRFAETNAERAQFPVKNKRCKIFSDFSDCYSICINIHFSKILRQNVENGVKCKLDPTFEISDRTITNFVAKFDDLE